MNDKPRAIKLVLDIEETAKGFSITVNARPATTPGGNALIVPHRVLAGAIRDELAAMPGALAGKGMNNPATAPNFRIAAGVLDVIAADAGARAALEKDLAGYADTDLVSYRSDPDAPLAAREIATWDPLCAWFEDRCGVALPITRAITVRPASHPVHKAVEKLLREYDPFHLAALVLATKAAGSIVIGLALCAGRIDADAAFAAAMLEELFQQEKWGADKEANAVRAVKHLDLEQAVRFVALLTED
jgi:chaperone required for assembly of F1-ATPase